MKKIIMMITLMMSFVTFSQVEVIEKQNKVEIAKSTTMDVHLYEYGDSSYALVFKDRRYATLSQYESIIFTDKKELLEFINSCKESMSTNKIYQTSKFVIFDSNSKVACVKNSMGAFTYINTKFINQVLEQNK